VYLSFPSISEVEVVDMSSRAPNISQIGNFREHVIPPKTPVLSCSQICYFDRDSTCILCNGIYSYNVVNKQSPTIAFGEVRIT
jgi:hypothetical protein